MLPCFTNLKHHLVHPVCLDFSICQPSLGCNRPQPSQQGFRCFGHESCDLFHLSKWVAVSFQFSTKPVWAGGESHGIPHIRKPLSRRCDGAKVRMRGMMRSPAGVQGMNGHLVYCQGHNVDCKSYLKTIKIQVLVTYLV